LNNALPAVVPDFKGTNKMDETEKSALRDEWRAVRTGQSHVRILDFNYLPINTPKSEAREKHHVI
jgi:hypothetical protein